MEIHNYMEDVVDVFLEDLLENFDDMCKCEKCKSDIKAIALNNLDPHYVATEKGEVYTKLNELNNQFKIDVYRSLITAINKVIENPHHEE